KKINILNRIFIAGSVEEKKQSAKLLFNYYLSKGEISKALGFEDYVDKALTDKIKIYSYRNQSSLILIVEDKGFPLEQISNSQINLSGFYQFLNYYNEITNCNTTLNSTEINQSGLKLITNFDINYSQNNSNPNYDQIKIILAPNINLQKIKMDINCSAPSNASTINYVDWQTTGTEIFSNITFFDETNEHNNGVYFSLNNQNNFSATYLDSSSYKIYSVHLDYIPSASQIIFWSDPNSTYITPYTKQNISCKFKFEAELNSTAYGEVKSYLPALLNLSCKNINYVGYPTIFRK
ncbi:MAG: hypothetical protein ACK4J0_02810, partial [Candidatus Anstonellaceae archaeon]